MKCNKKIYFLLILVLVMILVPFNVFAEDTTQTPGEGENTEIEEPVVPGTPTEDEITTPDDENVNEDNSGDTTTPIPEQPKDEEEEKTDTDTKVEDNVNTEKEENKKEQDKEDTKKEENKTNTTNKRPNVDYSTTIIDNAKKRVEISILGKDNQLLSGVKFQIQDKNGNIFYEEETTEEIFVFEEMELGTYYLVQVSTLEGYAKNTEKIEFVVSKESETVKVEMINELETEKEETKKEKDVFGMEVPLLSSIAMFDIALVIGIIVYVRKNKKVKAKK